RHARPDVPLCGRLRGRSVRVRRGQELDSVEGPPHDGEWRPRVSSDCVPIAMVAVRPDGVRASAGWLSRTAGAGATARASAGAGGEARDADRCLRDAQRVQGSLISSEGLASRTPLHPLSLAGFARLAPIEWLVSRRPLWDSF